MSLDLLSEESLRRFLLARMEASAREAVHRRLVEDTALFEQLAAAEDDLILDHLQGRLTLMETLRFRKIYLSSHAGRMAVDAVRVRRETMRRVLEQDEARPVVGVFQLRKLRWHWLTVAAACSLILATVLWKSEPGRTPPPASPPTLLTVLLLPPQDRGAPQRANIVPLLSTGVLRLRINQPGEMVCRAPRAVLRPVDLPTAAFSATANGTRGSGSVDYFVDLPPGALRDGDYIIEIDGAGEGATREICTSRNFRAAPGAGISPQGQPPQPNPGR